MRWTIGLALLTALALTGLWAVRLVTTDEDGRAIRENTAVVPTVVPTQEGGGPWPTAA